MSGVKRLEAQQGAGEALNSTMTLLYNIVQAVALAQGDIARQRPFLFAAQSLLAGTPHSYPY